MKPMTVIGSATIQSQGHTSVHLTTCIDLSSGNQKLYMSQLHSKQGIFFFSQFWLDTVSFSVFFFPPSILNKFNQRDSELKRENMSKCWEFWKYNFPNCAAWRWQDDKGPYNPVRTQSCKITQLARAIYVCYVPSAKQVLLNKWQIR